MRVKKIKGGTVSGDSFLFVANWKMNMHSADALHFCTKNRDALADFTANKQVQLIICPTFLVLDSIIKIFEQTGVLVGAQNCSSYQEGAYTGEVSARSLAEIGCTYSIVGHSERRSIFHESNNDVAKKVSQLLACDIEPIVCVGETKQEYDRQETLQVLSRQLAPVVKMVEQAKAVVIAYEPIWSVGTDVVPEKKYLADIFSWLFDYMQKRGSSVRFLYGGSVTENNVGWIKKIPHIGGFLVGRASTDFQMLQKIVLSKE